MGSVTLFIPTDRSLPTGIQIEGKVSCCVCKEAVDQSDVDRGDLFMATGAKGVYPAHVAHFYTENPATGKLDIPADDYQESLQLFALAYGIGEGLQSANRG
jgi:hypothetical protein